MEARRGDFFGQRKFGLPGRDHVKVVEPEIGDGHIPGDIDADAHFIWIVNPSRDIPDLVSDLETCLGGRRILPEFGPMDFEPQPFRALAKSDDLGFGESWHLRGASWLIIPVKECPTPRIYAKLCSPLRTMPETRERHNHCRRNRVSARLCHGSVTRLEPLPTGFQFEKGPVNCCLSHFHSNCFLSFFFADSQFTARTFPSFRPSSVFRSSSPCHEGILTKRVS